MNLIHMRLFLLASLLATSCSAALAADDPIPASPVPAVKSSSRASSDPSGKPKHKRKRRKKKAAADGAVTPAPATPASSPDSPRSS